MGQPCIRDGSNVDNRQDRLPVRLHDDRIIYATDKSNQALHLSDISHIRFCATFGSWLCLTLQAVNGRSVTLRWHALGPEASDYFSLSTELLTRVSRRNTFVTYSVGPSTGTWIAGWIGLLMLIGVIIGMAWAALTARGLPTFILPMALAPVALLIVVPIVVNGPSQLVGLQQLKNELSEHRPAP